MFFAGIMELLSKMFFFTSYFSPKGSFPKPLSPELEKDYITKMKNGDSDARENLIKHNMRLVVHVAKKYNSVMEMDDLISIGSIGLVKGITTFEEGKGTQLATYLARCIENEILMVMRSTKRYRNTVSLQEPLGVDNEGNEFTLMDVISIKEENIFKQVENGILAKKIDEILRANLSKREYQIIVLRFGLNGYKPLTQLETSKLLDISRSYISRIETKALSKVRNKINRDDFAE